MLPQVPFTFVRHGQTDWNVAGRMQGHTDIPLNATGIEQAHAAAKLLHGHGFTRIVASPLARARVTAEIIADAHNLPLETDDLLKERTFGSVEGTLWTELLAKHNLPEKASFEAFLPADAEPWTDIQLRSQQAITRWLNHYTDDHVLFVGHGAFFRALYEALSGEQIFAGNATPYHFRPTEAGWQLTTL